MVLDEAMLLDLLTYMALQLTILMEVVVESPKEIATQQVHGALW